MKKGGYVYILTNKGKNVLYTGVTSNIVGRLWQHKNKVYKGFSARYNVDVLVYYEKLDTIVDAIAREKQIKGGSRAKKIKLIESINPAWEDLCEIVLKEEFQ